MELQEFKSTVLPVKDRLYRLALHMLKSVHEAEDTLQDVMVKLWSKRMQLDTYRSVEALAVTMTRNLCLDRLKSKKNAVLVPKNKRQHRVHVDFLLTVCKSKLLRLT